MGSRNSAVIGDQREQSYDLSEAGRTSSVIASEARQSSSLRGGSLDCFVALLLAMTEKLIPLRGVLVEHGEHGERHRGDAGLDGRLRHRGEQRRMVARQRRPVSIARGGDAVGVVDADVEE